MSENTEEKVILTQSKVIRGEVNVLKMVHELGDSKASDVNTSSYNDVLLEKP